MGFGLIIGFIEHLIQLVMTLYKSLLHTDQCSQSCCLVETSSSRCSSASRRLMSSQACNHLTPTSYPDFWLQLFAPRLNSPTAGSGLSSLTGSQLTSNANWPCVIQPWHGLHGRHHFTALLLLCLQLLLLSHDNMYNG
jgi:hypothetical protein